MPRVLPAAVTAALRGNKVTAVTTSPCRMMCGPVPRLTQPARSLPWLLVFPGFSGLQGPTGCSGLTAGASDGCEKFKVPY